MKKTLREFCGESGQSQLLEQWDAQRNLPLTPDLVTYGSKKKVWWRCKQGHTWQASICTRTGNGTSCPVCAGKMPVAGENDLQSRYPELAREWHPTRNEITPQQVLPGSHKAVWWVCKRGHEWKASVKSRVVGSGCPVCANRMVIPKENDLATEFPEIAAQWHPTKNGTCTAYDVTSGSRRKIWWICEKGHEWQASVYSRALGGNGCPVCAGRKVVSGENDLASQFPEIAAQWHTEKNGTLTPQQVTPYANRKVWWKCELKHSYQAMISSRTMSGTGCPYCAGRKVLPGFNDLATLYPEIAKQWHSALNGALTPNSVTAGSHRKVWWQCAEGHVWQAVIYTRTGVKKCGCPVCAGRVKQTKNEKYRKIIAAFGSSAPDARFE